MTHVNSKEIEVVLKLIKSLQIRQSLLSETTLCSDDTLCPICYAKQNSAIFWPCQHQSCNSCIIQHLMNAKVCFYCKTFITSVRKMDGTILYEKEPLPSVVFASQATSINYDSSSSRIPRDPNADD